MATKPSKDAMEWAQQTTRGWAVSRAMVRELTLAMQEYADEAVATEREAVTQAIDSCEGDIDFLRFKLRARAEPEAR